MDRRTTLAVSLGGVFAAGVITVLVVSGRPAQHVVAEEPQSSEPVAVADDPGAVAPVAPQAVNPAAPADVPPGAPAPTEPPIQAPSLVQSIPGLHRPSFVGAPCVGGTYFDDAGVRRQRHCK